MSKFWGGSSDSEEEEDYSEDDRSEGEDVSGEEKDDDDQGALNDLDLSDTDSEEEKRVVKSGRDKRYEEMNRLLDNLNNHSKINDWNAIYNDFQDLNEWVKKANNLVRTEGVPGPYIAALIQLEELVKETTGDKEARKKMSKTNAKAFNTFSQKLRKHNKDHWASDIERYRKDPDSFNKSTAAAEPAQKEDEDEGTGDWADDVEDEPQDAAAGDDGDWEQAPGRGRKKKQPARKAAAVQEKPKEIVWTDKLIGEKLEQIVKLRGRKKAELKQLIASLKELLANAKEPRRKVEIYMQIVSTYFDITSNNLNKPMKTNMWNQTRTFINLFLDLLFSDPSLVQELPENDDNVLRASDYGNVPGESRVMSNLAAFVEQLDAEFIKALQNTDPHTNEYLDKLHLESLFLVLAGRVQEFFEKQNNMTLAARVAMKRIEHIYYKHDTLSEKIEEAAAKRGAEAKEDKPEGNTADKKPTSADIEKLCVLVYAHGDERLKTNALLCHVYHHSLHDRYHQARDLLLMSHIQDNVQHMEAHTQILFNRTMVQLGLCAFRKAYIAEAHSCLADICSGGKTREYLAQGISSQKYQEKTAEQEKMEQLRQVPYHMHINLDLLESVHLVSAMLLEVPYMASHPYGTKQKPISRALRRFMEIYDRQVFNGPPETTRDVCVNATKALAKGNWKRCEELLLNLPVWNLFHNTDQVKTMLKRKIQEEGLRTYIFTYSRHYEAMSLDQLSNLFELPQNTVHSVTSKMMLSKELMASWDQPTGAIIMHKAEPSRLQYLALQLADKAAILVENNERLLEAAKPGGYGYKFDTPKGGKPYERGARRGGRGGYQGQGERGREGYRGRGGRGGAGGQRNVADGFVQDSRRRGPPPKNPWQTQK